MTDSPLKLDALPVRDRFDAWRVLAAPFFEVRLPEEPARPFKGEVASVPLGDALLIRSSVSGQHYERDTARVRAGDWDQVAVQLYQSGGFVGDYDGTEVQVGAGDVNVIDFTRPYRKVSTDEADLNLIVPRTMASRYYPGFTHGAVKERTAPRASLIATQLTALAASGVELSAQEAGAGVEAVLMLLAQSDVRAGAATARASLRASVRHQAARYIRAHLLDPDLNPGHVARACRVSRATLFRAFAMESGVESYVRTERLHLAARRLREHPAMAIGDVASACGFLEPSQFTRQFRRAFDCSPKEARWRTLSPRGSGGNPESWLTIFRALSAIEPD